MASYDFTRQAVRDLENIWNYTLEQWSERQADKYYAEIIGQCQHAANNPNLGRNYEGVSESLRGLKINRHIIFYRIMSADLIEVTRILHERMDLKSRIGEK